MYEVQDLYRALKICIVEKKVTEDFNIEFYRFILSHREKQNFLLIPFEVGTTTTTTKPLDEQLLLNLQAKFLLQTSKVFNIPIYMKYVEEFCCLMLNYQLGSQYICLKFAKYLEIIFQRISQQNLNIID